MSPRSRLFRIYPKSMQMTILMVLLAILLLLGTTAVAQTEADALTRIETFLNALADQNNLSGAVLVAQDGEIWLSQSYGLANREWGIPNTPDTVFRIASLTKQFTAMAILMLQERGLLSVHDSICDYLRECPEAWQDVTIEHLLTHTSGIPDGTGQFGTSSQRVSPRRMIAAFGESPLVSTPGEIFSYNNGGYIILGGIIEEASGKSYGRFLQENIFEPLGMSDTRLDSYTTIIERRADGYSSRTQGAPYIEMSVPYAAGALVSTVEDLYRWNEALYSGQVISQETWDAMLDAAVPALGEEYAYGLAVGSVDDHPYIFHGGAINGFTSVMARLPDNNITIIVLSNLETGSTEAIGPLIAGMLLDEE